MHHGVAEVGRHREQKDKVVAVEDIDSEDIGPDEGGDTGRGPAVVGVGKGYGKQVVHRIDPAVEGTGFVVEDTGSEGIAVGDIGPVAGIGLGEVHIAAVVAADRDCEEQVERRMAAAGDRDCVKAGPGVDLEGTAGILADPHRDLVEGDMTYFWI